MEKEQKFTLLRIIISAIMLISSLFIKNNIAVIVLCVTGYMIISYDIVFIAIKNIFKGGIFDEHFLMTIASIGAFTLQDFKEAVAVTLFYQVGELLQDIAVDKSKKSISKLMDLRPDYANIEKEGQIVKVNPNTLSTGDLFVVYPGERIPLDGVIIQGATSLNTSSLTGESLPLDVSEGDEVISGCVNLSGVIKVKATKEFAQSTASKLLQLVQNSENNKAKSEKFITKFAKIYTPIVVALALVVAIVPSLITGLWNVWVKRALIFLVISCPCAMVVSIPLAFFAGIGGASKKGVLIKGANHIETLSKIKSIAFDKTGTLTKGNFAISVIHPSNFSEEELLEICALVEYGSSHPIAQSIVSCHGKQLNLNRVKDVENLAGLGIKAKVDDKIVYVGNQKLLDKLSINECSCKHYGTTLHIVVNNEYAGHIVVKDEIKPTSAQAIASLKALGITNLVMLTGDKKEVAEEIGNEIGITEILSNLLPNDKVDAVKNLKSTSSPVMFVGDGINDAPVMKEADCSIAMGGLGSDATIESADVVLMDDNPCKISSTIKISRKTMKLARENIGFALFVKILMMSLGAAGLVNLWGAVFADAIVSLIAILNSLRALANKN